MNMDTVYINGRLVSRPRYKLVYIRRRVEGIGPAIVGFQTEEKAEGWHLACGPTVCVEQRQLERRVGPGFSMWFEGDADYSYLDALLQTVESDPPNTLRLNELRGF